MRHETFLPFSLSHIPFVGCAQIDESRRLGKNRLDDGAGNTKVLAVRESVFSIRIRRGSDSCSADL
jgi:hypothetical protein